MKKAIAYLFVFLLLVSTCQASDTLDSALDPNIQKKDSYGRTLTYDLLEERPFINSEVLKSDYAQVLIVPADVKYQESFVSLEKDVREQKIGPWSGGVKAGPKKMLLNLNVEDVTGIGNVRVVKPRIGVEYKVSENSAIGVEASRGIHDTLDAAAWGKPVKDEKAAEVKYKILF